MKRPRSLSELLSLTADAAATLTLGLACGMFAYMQSHQWYVGAAVGVAAGYTVSAIYFAIVPLLHTNIKVSAIVLKLIGGDQAEEDLPANMPSGSKAKSPRAPIGFAMPKTLAPPVVTPAVVSSPSAEPSWPQ